MPRSRVLLAAVRLKASSRRFPKRPSDPECNTEVLLFTFQRRRDTGDRRQVDRAISVPVASRKARSLSHHRTIWQAVFRPKTDMDQFAGIVRTGACGVTPVSASEKNIIRNEKIRFEARSPSSIQYHVSRYRTAV